jgi:hypothetical protein
VAAVTERPDLHTLTATVLERTVAHLDRLDRQSRRRPWEMAAAFGGGIMLGMWAGVALAITLLGL